MSATLERFGHCRCQELDFAEQRRNQTVTIPSTDDRWAMQSHAAVLTRMPPVTWPNEARPLRSASRSKTKSVSGLLPNPVARQTIEHVSRAEAVFVEPFTLAMGRKQMSQIEFECRITWFQAAIAWWDAQTRALIELHNSGVFRLSFVEEVA